MAEGILFNIIGEIITKLSSQAVKELGMLRGVKHELSKLTNSATAIKAILLDAEDQQFKNAAIKDWLEKLKDAFYDVEDVIDEFSTEALRREVMTRDKKAKQVRIFSKSNQVVFRIKMAHKIKNVRKDLDAIAADRSKFHFIENLGQNTPHVSIDHIREREDTHSFIPDEEVVARKDEKEIIKNHLLDMNARHDISILAIVGMGGLGKTTLAKFVYNDMEVSEFFELRIWVCVSELFDVKVVVRKIIESATNSRPETCEIECLQSQLRKVIQGKKYLLVLDDIWNENEEKWFDLKNLLMGGAKGSKIVITKRDNKLVAEIADMTSLYNLKGLSEEGSWSLFRKVAFKGGEEPNNPNLIKLGKEIVQKCKGVPLVIRSIGRVLYFKTSEEEWMSFKDKQLENDVMSKLKLSYDHLPPYLKQCFAYCSLFPKDYTIKKDDLIRQSIAQGFVQSSNQRKSLEDIGDDYFTELCWRSMLQFLGSVLEYVDDTGNHDFARCLDFRMPGAGRYLACGWNNTRGYQMHDLMHDLAEMVAGNECKLIHSEVDDGVNEKTRYISISLDGNSKMDFPTSILKAKGLRSLLFLPNSCSGLDVLSLDKLFSSFVHLRLLKLSRLIITEVPNSIEKLRNLRYLDLSHTWIESLPKSMSKLQNLQTLDLKGCRNLKELPRDIGNLLNLRHLVLSEFCITHFKHMPKGMGKLTCLQTLNLFVLGEKNDRQASKLSELKGLHNLRGRLHLKGLKHLRSNPSEASLACLKDKKGLRLLRLQWEIDSWDQRDQDEDEQNDEMVLEGLEPHPNLESLSIFNYGGVGLSNWASSLLKLTEIHIGRCRGLQHLPRFDQLPTLKHLCLRHLITLEFIDIDESSSSSSSVFFPSLQVLVLGEMPNLKGWLKWESKRRLQLPSFPPLALLEIYDCPKLASMPLHSDINSIKLCDVSLQTLELPITSILRPAGSSNPYPSSNTFSPSVTLERLELQGIGDLEFLPEKLWQHLNNLKFLSIDGCHKFQVCVCQDMRNPTSVGDIHAVNCKKLEEKRGKQGKLPQSLEDLSFFSLPKLVSLPIELRYATTLQTLDISWCCNFTHLPEWIGSLVSLRSMKIHDCPKLKSLPEGMRQLKALQCLRITDCPEVKERCKEGGEDYPKIAHVPDFIIC